MIESIFYAALGGFLGLLLGSLTEYWVHILMHRRVLLSRTHFNHHREPEGENVPKQFAYYVLGSSPFLTALAVGCWAFGVLPFGLGLFAGGILWAGWVAYAHTLQHERPDLVFWMKRPIHHLHHEHHCAGNFGLSVDWWDHAFGTYVVLPWERPAGRRRLVDYLTIRWV